MNTGGFTARRVGPKQRPRWVTISGAMLWGVWFPLPLLFVLAGIVMVGHLFDRAAPPGGVHRTRFDQLIRHEAEEHMPDGWDWRIFKAMIQRESQFDSRAESHVGARGLGQIMPATAGDLGVAPADLYTPRVSLDASARYLRDLWERWPAVPDVAPRWTRSRLAIASYNAGPTTVRRAYDKVGGVGGWTMVAAHVPRETQRHIDRVFERYYPPLRKLHTGSAVGVHDADLPPRMQW